jgi:hypothetical protein
MCTELFFCCCSTVHFDKYQSFLWPTNVHFINIKMLIKSAFVGHKKLCALNCIYSHSRPSVFWEVTWRSLELTYQHFRGYCWLSLQSRQFVLRPIYQTTRRHFSEGSDIFSYMPTITHTAATATRNAKYWNKPAPADCSNLLPYVLCKRAPFKWPARSSFQVESI